MMASRRRQEEKHLQTLKNLLQIECNKRCFECDQRGPTYVDVTIGSFVCTSCGGILRGLNPPHRVKSVSMATFTPTEIAFIETRGNEYCKNIYLGKYDARSKARPESKSDHGKLKYFMEQKYEQKRWYVPPEQAQKPLGNITQPTNGAKSGNVKPLNTLLGNNAAPIKVEKSSPAPQPKVDTLFADFGSSINSEPSHNQSVTATTSSGFADFGNAFSTSFDSFGDFASGQSSNPPVSSTTDNFANFSNVLTPNASNSNQPVATSKSADKYADLADLFSTPNTGSADMSMWSGFSSSSGGGLQNSSNISVFGNTNTGQTQQVTSVFGNSQPPSSFSNIPQQTNIFGSQPTQSIYGQAATAGVQQNQSTAGIGGMQQQPSLFGSPSQTMSGYGNMSQATNTMNAGSFGATQFNQQQTTMSSGGFGGSQFNTGTFGTTAQTTYGLQQSQPYIGGNMQSASIANPFMQSSVTSTMGTQSGSNPFMAQQTQQKHFATQAAGTNPFMNKPNPAQTHMSTNPFF